VGTSFTVYILHNPLFSGPSCFSHPKGSKTKRKERQVVVPPILAGWGLERGVKRYLIMGAVISFPPLCCSAELLQEEAQLIYPALWARFTLTKK
jgi:hypothetical protein